MKTELQRVILPTLVVWLAVVVLAFDDPASMLAQHGLVVPLAFLGAVIANATAVGGGIVFMPLFIFGYGIAALPALKLALASQAFGMTSGALGWSPRFIIRRALLLGGTAAGVGTFLGTYVWVPENVDIKLVFGWCSVCVGAALFAEMLLGKLGYATRMQQRGWMWDAAFVFTCLGGGIINAWVSIGIGEVMALWLMLGHRIRVPHAIATGVATLSICSLLGLAFHAHLGGIPWTLLAFTAPGCLLGGRYGAQLGRLVEEYFDRRRQGRSGWLNTHFSPVKAFFATVVLADGTMILVGRILLSY